MTIHKDLASGHWFELSLVEQLANIGADVERCLRWSLKNNQDKSRAAFDRAIDLIDLTVKDPKNRNRLREILRVREALIDYYLYDNEYNSTAEQWQRYFYQFNYAAAIARGR
jgi:hypothetical protein